MKWNENYVCQVYLVEEPVLIIVRLCILNIDNRKHTFCFKHLIFKIRTTAHPQVRYLTRCDANLSWERNYKKNTYCERYLKRDCETQKEQHTVNIS